MAKDHGARQQKRAAKQKAKREAKRSFLFGRTTKDPTIRLRQAGSWPIFKALVSDELWDEGIGYALIARQEPGAGLVFASFVVDVRCLGVKNAFWRAGSRVDFEDMLREMEKVQKMVAIAPECLAKIIKGAVEFARSFGFPPHHDYRHASTLLDGIDPSTCKREFTFGRDGKPYYIQGPNETPAQAQAIARRVVDVGGHFIVQAFDLGERPEESEEGEDPLDSLYENVP